MLIVMFSATRKKEMIRGNKIITFAKGEPGVGWVVVGVCEINI
jgi:hypothetical protein